MSKNPINIDWTYIRSFLAVAESGSLTAAANKTNQTQPTVGRHITAAETTLGAQLFTRKSAGLALTEAGLKLLEPARDMAKASARFANLAAGHDLNISGTVRITASVVVSHYILPAVIAEFRKVEPNIEIELVPSDTSESLIFREADIAIRMYRPTQLDIITRKIVDQPVSLYASKDFLTKHGNPQNLEELALLPFVGFDKSDVIIRAMQTIGLKVDNHFFGVRCDDQVIYWELVRKGCGVGAMQTIIADDDPFVEKLDYQPELPNLPVWLAAHEELFKTPRVKRVWQHLADQFIRK
jgi:DNA-binding transcriptional LysR family regulator